MAYRGGARPEPAARRLAIAIVAVASLELVLLVGVAPWLNGSKSPRPIAQALAFHNPSNHPTGLYDLSPLEGALVYYGAGPIERLDDVAAVESFRSSGGSAVLMRARHASALREAFGLRTIDSFRSGDRALELVHFVRDREESRGLTPRPWGDSRPTAKPGSAPR